MERNRKRAIFISAVVAVLLALGSLGVSLWWKNETTQNAKAEFIAYKESLHYENQFFSVDLPDSWAGSWKVEESTETREAIYATAAYTYDFSNNEGASFSVRCALTGIDSEAVIGGSRGYSVHLYIGDDSDSDFIRNHIVLK